MFTSPAAVTAVALTLLSTVARGALEITGSATCPTPAQVEAEVAHRSGTSSTNAQRAELDPDLEQLDPPRLRLRLFDSSDKLLGERTLPADARCQALAVTVATMLLSFELDLGEAPPLDTTPAPAVAAPAPAAVHHTFKFEAGLGGFFSWVPTAHSAGAGLLLTSLSIDGSPFQPELAAELESARGLSVGSSSASWERFWAAPGVQYRFLRRPNLWAAAHLDVPVAVALATGAGNLETPRSGSVFDFGIAGGIRLGLGPAPLSRIGKSAILPWAGVWVIGWPLQRGLFLSNSSEQSRLPVIEVLAGVGLRWSSL